MQGRKNYQEELFVGFQLSERVPEQNFYRRLKGILDLKYLYKLTEHLYGKCGQKSIDPVVFFKLSLVGYLENITSDRQLITHCSMRLDLLFFIGYNISDPMPWHSTFSRTRNLFPTSLFEKVFEDILKKCIDAGLVSGHTQVIDSAPVKANASMDSIELKVPKEELEEHLNKVRYQSTPDREKQQPRRKTKENKANKEQQTITATDRELKGVKAQQKNWQKKQDQRPGAQLKTSKYTSNKTHYSPTDPDARISVKPGKARKLNYHSQLVVDPATHVITYIAAAFADKKDSRCLPQIIEKLQPRLKQMGLLFTNVLADTGYSSGANYKLLEEKKLQAFIPTHGTYKGNPNGFEYHKEENYYLCKNGKKVTFRKIKEEKTTGQKKFQYLTRRSDCKGCPFKTECIGKGFEKRIEITVYKEYYERTKTRLATRYGRIMKSKRQSTVEPVFGTLTQFMGMRKVNTKGIANAHKQMLMAGIAYNLKKILKYAKTPPKSVANSKALLASLKNELYWWILSCFNPLIFT